MLNSKFRFHSRGGVRYVYKHGQTIRQGKMALVYCENTRGFQRFSVVVSKKVEKSAVGRNRIRRRIYEAIRLYKKSHSFDAKRDYIFIVYSKDLMDCPFTEVERMIADLIRQSAKTMI